MGRPKTGASGMKNARVPLIERFGGILPASPQFVPSRVETAPLKNEATTPPEQTVAIERVPSKPAVKSTKPKPISDEADDKESAEKLRAYRQKEADKKSNFAKKEEIRRAAVAKLKKK